MADSVIPPEFVDLFKQKAFGHLATIMPDGSPQITPVWIDYDGECILINSRTGRQKNNNMRRNPRVAVEISDPQNAYRYISIRGTVIEVIPAADTQHIDALAQRYLDVERYPWGSEDETREIFRIRVDRVVTRMIKND